MIEQIKNIRNNFKNVTLRKTLKDLESFRSDLTNYKYNNKINDIMDYEIYKICHKMDRSDILEMTPHEVVIYLNYLVSIVEFTFTDL